MRPMEMANFTSGAQGAHTAVFKTLDRWNKNLSLERSLDLDLVSADWLCGGRAGNFQGWAIKQNDNESITTIRNKMIRMIMNQ